jgi:hypothetical protein
LINFGYLLRVLRWSTANFVAGADTVSALVHEACISKKENDGLELAPRTLLMQRPQWTRVCCALRQVRLRLHHFRFALRRNVSVEFDDISCDTIVCLSSFISIPSVFVEMFSYLVNKGATFMFQDRETRRSSYGTRPWRHCSASRH